MSDTVKVNDSENETEAQSLHPKSQFCIKVTAVLKKTFTWYAL